MTHTPGPWLVAPSDFAEQLEVIADVVSEDDHLNIATVYGGFKNEHELAANTRLICTAPEMAAEIVRLRDRIEELERQRQTVADRDRAVTNPPGSRDQLSEE